jgi:hypothetical protein
VPGIVFEELDPNCMFEATPSISGSNLLELPDSAPDTLLELD